MGLKSWIKWVTSAFDCSYYCLHCYFVSQWWWVALSDGPGASFPNVHFHIVTLLGGSKGHQVCLSILVPPRSCPAGIGNGHGSNWGDWGQPQCVATGGRKTRQGGRGLKSGPKEPGGYLSRAEAGFKGGGPKRVPQGSR